jgi:acyl-coenzyme A thioesterase PaaI-like protein
MTAQAPPTNSLLRSWQRARSLPAGERLFSYLLRRKVPYSGSIAAQVVELTPGYAKVRMADRPRLRNHLDSIHAVAMTNLGELASGLAMTAAMPPQLRGIPVQFTVEFLRKARGEIVAEGRAPRPEAMERRDYEVKAILEDRTGTQVALFTARWIVGPKD